MPKKARPSAQTLLGTLQDGRIKLYLTWNTLTFRRAHEALFRDGDYLPLKVHGAHAERVCAFARQFGGQTLLVVVPRLLAGIMGEDGHPPVGRPVWGETWVELPPERQHDRWRNVLINEMVDTRAIGEVHGLELDQVFATFPYALLLVHSANGRDPQEA